MKINKIPLKEFKKIYSRVPRLCVDLVIKNDKDEALLSMRDIPPKKGWWHFPGGTVLMGESLEDTIQRVAQEELNTKVKILKQIGINEYPDGSGLGYPIAIVYLVKPLGKIVGGEQARNIKYFNKVPPKTLPVVENFLDDLLRPNNN